MSQLITFENALLGGAQKKKGILKPMADNSGYYRINAGGFNIPNRWGIDYPINAYLKECAREGSDFDRRVSEGQLYCELDHPKPFYKLLIHGEVVQKRITDLFEWINRLRTIDVDNVCGHIRKVHWTAERGWNGPVLNDIEVIPFGLKAEFLRQSLPNPDVNTAFSIRTVTKPQEIGDKSRQVDYWSTYDAVVDQGIIRACKHLTAGMESLLEGWVPTELDQSTVTTTLEEMFFICDQKLANPEVRARYQGMESFDRVQAMLKDMKSRVRGGDKQIKLVTTSSAGIFM